MSEIKTIQDFLSLENPAGYDFREQIIPFKTEDPFARHVIYQAIGIAEQDLEQERRGEDASGNRAYEVAQEIYAAYQYLLEEGEADTSDLVMDILAELNPGQKVESGDTMNSIQTTLNKVLHLPSKRAMVAKYARDPAGIAMDEWLEPYEPEARRFLELAYTIGNFIPCPPGCNRPGRSLTKDYWDLTLWYIYCFYHCTPARRETYLEKIFWEDRFASSHIASYGRWLESFESWDDFVEQNFLQDYTQWDARPYGKPREFWDGHFDGSPMPKTQEQFEAFFTRSAACIEARGRRMVEALRKSREAV